MGAYAVKLQILGGLEIKKNTGKNSGTQIEVFDGKVKLGTIFMGRGTFDWYTKHAKTFTKHGRNKPTHSLSWTKFAELMNTEAKKGS